MRSPNRCHRTAATEPLPPDRLAALDARLQLTGHGNSEIAHAWYKIAIRNRCAAADNALEQYLVSIDRRKLIVPLYQALLKTPEGAARARAIYAKARPGYHPIAQTSLDALMR